MLPRIYRFGVAGGNFAKRSSPLGRRLRQISALERLEEARAFLNDFHEATGAPHVQRKARWADVRRLLNRTETYDHTSEELAYGARLAWRNHGRCIGRLFWESLEVVDCRHITEPDAMANRIASHMTEAHNDGRIRSIISIFAPVRGSTLPAYVESSQIVQYAGYVQPDGSIIGDRQNVEVTRVAQSLGWTSPDDVSPFDLLPFLIRDKNDRRAMFSLPTGITQQVQISHPTCPEISNLGLRWYTVPCVSGLILTIGGIDYPCAPFNGFYMGTEIGSRNFADRKRYDLLPIVAKALGLDSVVLNPPLWKDTALTELNRAVLHSFKAAGVTMLDHHTASEQFMEFHKREQANGRRVAADWRWIVPPQASATTEVFHLKMKNFHPVPNYYGSRSVDGLRLMPYYGDAYRPLSKRILDRLTRRWKLWKRMAW